MKEPTTTYVCTTCGAHYPESSLPPKACIICQDERQYVHPKGQSWTTMKEALVGRELVIKPKETHLFGIGIEPSFAIGQRALLLQTTKGNILWDCIPLVSDQAVRAIKKLGGLDMIAISHPHYYSACVEWSRAFGNIPVYLHEDDKQWVTRPDDSIVYWKGETLSLKDDLTVIRCGGHFSGGSVLHWPQGAENRGALLTGDIIDVVKDRRFVSFMYSYPNLIPLSCKAIQKIKNALQPYSFDRIYGAWWGATIEQDAKEAVARSVDRYIRAISS